TLAPEVLPEFNALVLDITAKGHDSPWRASLRMESGGMHAQRMKSLFLSIFSWASPSHNNRIRQTLSALQEIDGQGDAVVRLRMSFATWAPVGQGETLRRNAQAVMGTVKRWGNSGVDGISGDPMATVLSSAPGITTASTAPVSSGPMRDVLALMPLGRQASPWEHGTLLLRTPSGKPWPFQPTSSKQTTWITLTVGTPGSGKSVFLNTVNFASVLSPSIAGGDEPVLPRIAIIDIGPSSAGLISLVQEALPANKRHLAMFQRLKMSKEHAVNVFDTHLGMRRPTAADRQFIGNFVNLICSDGDTPPSSPMRGLIGAAIDRAYETGSDEREPKRYLEGDEARVDNALRETQFDRWESASWWMVVDHLMINGRLYEAELAQRHAVPTLSDLVTASQAEQVRSLYGNAMDAETHQPLTESFQRMISEVVRDYPILAGTTRYSIGSSRVVSMDLMEVTSRGASAQARKQTAMMYMLARQMMTRDFFLDEAEFRIAVRDGILPQAYLEHHVTRARDNAQVPKIICMDEFHRTGGNPSITDQVMQDGREGRKFNVDLRIASQLIEDFPTPIIEIASTLLVCNVGSENSIRVMDEMFGLSEGEKKVLRYNLRGPSRRGAPVWAMFKLKGEGQVRQELNLTLGPVELWAYSTTAEDVALRNRLYESLGPRLARRVLAARYPGGSAKSDIETRIARLEELGERLDDDSRGDVIGKLVEELKAQAYAMSSADAA
ncbi:ATP-binding protein, partial [Palleronia sp.]|uniref:ATP-binding protein n=1 Tax=Palleronia sp. TaxID=1940284 RepID=UPI0035C855DB